MAKRKGYKRGIATFLIISIGTFALMFFFGNDSVKGSSFTKMLLVERYSDKGSLKLNVDKIVRKQIELDNRVIPVKLGSQTNFRAVKESLLLLKGSGNTNLKYVKLNNTITNQLTSYLKSSEIDSILILTMDKNKITFKLINKFKGSLSVLDTNLKISANEKELIKIIKAIFNKINYQERKFNILESFLHIQPLFLLFALGLWLIALLLDSYIVKYLLNVMHDDMPFKECIYSILGFEFLNAVTPFQSGGQPLMIYIMHRNKVPVGKGILITFLKTAGQTYFFALTAPIVMLVLPGLVSLDSLGAFYLYAVFFFGYFIVLSFFVIFKPHVAKKLVFFFFKFLHRFNYFRKKNISKTMKKVLKEINIFTFYIGMIIKEKKFTFLWVFIVTGVSWIVKFMIAVAVIWGLGGFAVDVLQVLSVQTVTNFIAYFAPSPGGSGVVEFSMQKIFEHVLQNGEIVFAFVVIWRFISYYISVFLGGLLIVKILKIKHEILDEEEEKIEHDYKIPSKSSPKAD